MDTATDLHYEENLLLCVALHELLNLTFPEKNPPKLVIHCKEKHCKQVEDQVRVNVTCSIQEDRSTFEPLGQLLLYLKAIGWTWYKRV